MTILPNCNRCGQCGCECGALPYTMTVTLSDLQNKAHSAHCPLTITSDFGSGASVIAMTPGGDSKGPLASVLVLDGGCGYAKVGHVLPSLVISGGSGTGATFTPTLAPVDESVSATCRTWKLASATMAGGSGYVVGEALTIRAVNNSIEVSPASATLTYGRLEPTVTATAGGNGDATLTVSLSPNGDNPATWGVSGVAVDDGGTGYTNGAAVSFAVGTGETEEVAAVATIVTELVEPTLSAAVAASVFNKGSGASFGTPILTSITPDPAWGISAAWGVASIPITNGGSGYMTNLLIDITVVDGAQANGTYILITGVDASGAITSVAPSTGGEGAFYKDTGVIESVSVTTAGKYYGESAAAGAVVIGDGGEYYRESKAAAACVADVTITGCTTGTASLSPVIDTSPSSPSFGQLTGVEIEDGGDDTSVWNWQQTRQELLNDLPLVLVASSPKKLVTLALESCYGSGACARVNAVGERVEPTLKLYAACRPPDSCESCEDGTIMVSLSSHTDDDGRPYWSLASASASGGSGYTSSPDVHVEAGNLCLAGNLPSVTVSTSGGALAGATITDAGKFWWQLNYEGQPGPIREVELIDGGSGYARLGREEPALTITGGNATFTPTLSKHTDDCGLDYWRIDSVEVTGGTGYTNGQGLTVSLATENDHAEQAAVLSVQASTSGIPSAVTVTRPGRYYRENDSLPPYVADVTVVVKQLAPSDGSGAAFTVEVDDDTASATFGSVVGVSLTDGGSDYQILGAPLDCSYGLELCRENAKFQLALAFRGRNRTPVLTVREYLSGVFLTDVAVLEGDSPLTDCASPPSSASLLYGAQSGSAAISPGGAVASDCEPTGYCGGEPPSCAWTNGCPTVTWAMQFVVDNPNEWPNIGNWVYVAPGTYSFSGQLNPPEPPLPIPPGYGAHLYDPAASWMIQYPTNSGGVCAGTFDWPDVYPYGYHYDSYGAAGVSILCLGNRFYVSPQVFTTGYCGGFCGPAELPFGTLFLGESNILAHGEIPIEWVNGMARLKEGSHTFNFPAWTNGSCTLQISQVTLNVSYP